MKEGAKGIQRPKPGFPTRAILVDPTLIVKLIQEVADHNYQLGLAAGERRARQNSGEDQPGETETTKRAKE